PNLRQTQDAMGPRYPRAPEAEFRRGAFPLEPRVTRAVSKEVPERCILIAKALLEARAGRLCEPLVPCRVLPLGEPARKVGASQSDPALTVGFRSDFQPCVPQPSRGPEPALQQAALGTIWIGANSITSPNAWHGRILTLSSTHRTAEETDASVVGHTLNPARYPVQRHP